MRAIFAIFSVLVVLLSGCGTSAGGCVDNADCADLQVCARQSANQPGTCTNVECVTNEDCALGNFCNEAGFFCAPGCTSNLDCRAGENCDVNSNTCVQYGCRDTNLDCAYGEFCQNGSCVDATGHCEVGCDTDFDCGSGYCLGFDSTGTFNCAFTGCPSGQACYYTDASMTTTECLVNRCLAGCSQPTDCPRGFQCQPIDGIGSLCIADCEYIDQWRN
ncbi:MAG: hypothetical protein EP330_27275 [Deltaproteobacteria bacterium]|nr:MAG: hypothetical protein EP330_27275 [Deltaproteobacteria bacterium]